MLNQQCQITTANTLLLTIFSFSLTWLSYLELVQRGSESMKEKFRDNWRSMYFYRLDTLPITKPSLSKQHQTVAKANVPISQYNIYLMNISLCLILPPNVYGETPKISQSHLELH